MRAGGEEWWRREEEQGSRGREGHLQFVYLDDLEVPVIPVERSPASLSSS